MFRRKSPVYGDTITTVICSIDLTQAIPYEIHDQVSRTVNRPVSQGNIWHIVDDEIKEIWKRCLDGLNQ